MSSAQKTAHTPGPWHYGPDGMGDFTIASEGDLLAIASVPNGSFMTMGGHGDEHEANARLMTAAPELLAALKALMDEAPFGLATTPDANWAPSVIEKHKAWIAARAAIAKAEGRADG